MCGIIGYCGPLDAQTVLLNGLTHLEYRGYDSAGIALFDENSKIHFIKKVGKVAALRKVAINDRLRALRRELKLCARIENDAPTVRANVGAGRSETHEKTDKSRPDRHPPSGGRVPADRGR